MVKPVILTETLLFVSADIFVVGDASDAFHETGAKLVQAKGARLACRLRIPHFGSPNRYRL